MSNGYPEQGVAQKKKGLHPMAWVAIGCGGLLIVGGLVAVLLGVFAVKKAGDAIKEFEENPAKAAEMFVRLSPELELVESNEENGTITIRSTQTGEEATFDYSELADGKFSWSGKEGESGSVSIDAQGGEDGRGTFTVESDKGSMSLGGADVEAPDWLPLYPGAQKTEGATFTTTTQEGRTAAFALSTDDSVDEVLEYYAQALEEAGFTIQTQTYTRGGAKGGIVTGVDHPDGHTVNVTAGTEDGGKTQLGIQFQEKSAG